MLCILMVLYYHLPPLSPTTTTKRRQIKGEKKTEMDFLNGILQIKAMTQKSGPPQSMSSSTGSLGKCATWAKYFIAVTWFFSKSRQESEVWESRQKCLGLVFSPQVKFVCWLNKYIHWPPPECQALCSAEDVLVNVTVPALTTLLN